MLKPTLKISPMKKSELSISRVLKRYNEINQLRLNRIDAALTKRQQDFLTLIPFIFHSNHEKLPGYVPDCPSGIPDFRVTPEMKFAAKKINKSFNGKLKAFRSFDLLALYLMGSPGSIAFSNKSDFDFWLCYNPSLSSEALAMLDTKVEILTQWADELDLEITIFLVNYLDFRQGKSIPLSVESSGSSQLLLLLEEFYRTAILLCGRYPVWWIIAPEVDDKYDETLKELEIGMMIKDNMVNKNDYLDFGPVNTIPSSEFLGATVWQIYKGIDSPYKSILKLMIMEAYANEFPNFQLLSSIYKNKVYNQENLTLEDLDPYLLLLEKLTNYLQSAEERLFLMRRCFYLKIDCKLNKKHQRPSSKWQVEIVRQLVKDWDWNEYTHQLLDHKENWTLQDVMHEQKTLVNALTTSYRKLNDFFKKYGQTSTISQRDLNLLGRKLHAAFERKAGKIEIINRQFKDQLVETHVSLHEFVNSQKEKGWKVYLGVVHRKEMEERESLKKSANIMKLINWLFFNGAINQHTKFLIHNFRGYKLDFKEISHIISSLNKIYPGNYIGKASLEALSRPGVVEKNCLFVNVLNDPFENNNNINQFATNQTDSLRYGASHRNLVLSIDVVYNTSWKEVMYAHYNGETAIVDCICQYLRWNNNTSPIQKILPDIVQSFSSSRATFIAQRVEEIIKDVVDAFYQVKRSYQRYIFALGRVYYMIGFKNDEPYYQKLKTMDLLIQELSLPRKYYSTLTVDNGVKEDTNLKSIFKRNQSGKVQIFYLVNPNYVDIYVLDDLGSLYYIRQNVEQDNVQINHYILFLNTIIQRRLFHSSSNVFLSNDEPLNLGIYKMYRRDNELKIVEQSIESFSLPSEFISIQVIGHSHQETQSYFSIFCDGNEFSGLDYGQDLYKEFAKYIIEQRPSGLKYPIYLTDMDLDQESVALSPVQVCQLLKYKEQIETKLNHAIKEI
ncbi:MAG: class I adenylate cyclase [Gammaproteobacteria bacterium]|nr:class I adenylate cyclase [Gammaproteobacteria bacterium]